MFSTISVSVLVTSFNRQETIAQTIESILRQKFNGKYEIIIGDDGSTDNTRNICLNYQKSYPDIIKLVFHNNNCGLGKNWAILVSKSKGKYIASCDDDDYWHNPNKLQMQVDVLESDLCIGMVHTEKDILIEPNRKIIKNFNKTSGIEVKQGFIINEIFRGQVPICVSTTLVRKEVIDKYVPLSLYIENEYNIQDWPTWMYISKYTKIMYLDVSTTTYRVGHPAISNYASFDKVEKKIEKDRIMYKLICDNFPTDLVYDDRMYDQYILNILLTLSYKKFNYKKASKYIKLYSQSRNENFKIRMAKNFIFFYLFCIFKYLFRVFSHTRLN
ncbi:glycosyltransferase [Spirosoma fluviale]|uniref:Glycosyltransferase involved in cell wall bisynthesis n=1 Tax=Spirosoma fluviale TaxID=1597977 RepID=A0A286FE21_9BACT|nr:glycosyltransferase [Spirosoma fluviale]SOD81239.1 Glycosyltransferase involved in cell wall bisynthesis [Spirosoma fluviale]